jgi:hypothetical protein
MMEGDHSAPNNVWRDVFSPCADLPPLPLVAPAAVGAEACFASETAFAALQWDFDIGVCRQPYSVMSIEYVLYSMS